MVHPIEGTFGASSDAEEARWVPIGEVKKLLATRAMIGLFEKIEKHGAIKPASKS
nr:hypothetical protein [Candidatus Njordarchaeota archaeon]